MPNIFVSKNYFLQFLSWLNKCASLKKPGMYQKMIATQISFEKLVQNMPEF